jgi:hypothetical protein
MNIENFNKISAEIADQHQQLKDSLAKRPPFPQVGDIVIFANPKTLGFQWLLIKKDSNNLLMLPADNNPLAGSNDINSDLLTLRCGHKFLIHKDKLKTCERVGILDNWDLQYVLDKQVRSSALQQETDYDPDYQAWMRQVEDAVKAISKVSFLERIKQKVINWMTVQPYQKLAFAAILVLVMIIILPSQPDSPIDIIYKTIYANKNLQTEQKLAQLKFRWEKSARNGFTFGPNSQDSKAAKAFGAGLLFSRESLLNKTSKDHWLNTEWKSDFNLGRWAVLLWIASQQNMSDTFWKQQQDILSQFKTEFQARKVVLFQLEKHIEPYLSSAPIKKYMLRIKLQNIMNFLAPRG